MGVGLVSISENLNHTGALLLEESLVILVELFARLLGLLQGLGLAAWSDEGLATRAGSASRGFRYLTFTIAATHGIISRGDW